MQVHFFGGYTRNLTDVAKQVRHARCAKDPECLCAAAPTLALLQVQQSHQLQEQLKNAVESNANLSRLFTSLNSQIEEILTDDSFGKTESLLSNCNMPPLGIIPH